ETAQALSGLAALLSARGYALQERGEIAAAIECYEEALALEPSLAQAHNNLGNAYKACGRQQDAVASYRDAVAADPTLAEAHLNLGIALYEAGRLGEAAQNYRAARELKPALAEASLNLGFLLEQEGDARGAREAYRAAIAARPDFAEAHFNHALQLLQAGEFEAGWEEYEWRLKLPELAPFWPYAGRQRWNGEELRGRRILLYAEQGFGDAIQFVRYAPLVAARGGEAIVSCPPKLLRLFRTLSGVSATHDAQEPPPDFDLCCSLLSLPRLFHSTLDTIPVPVPYLHARAEDAARWQSKLAALGPGLKVGLYWSTDSKNRITPLKSLELETLAALAGVPGVAFVSLQRGAAAAQAARPPQGMKLIDASAELRDFADDAALIANLDLVISIDTATAHLAGALGRPVWTLVHFPAEWRWLAGREDSPWYPTMRLFLRRRSESWHDVAGRVRLALQALQQTNPGRE
ncbi:MAG: tetratricopeptide repeat protein, partial [Pseudomonadota bacterium]